MFGALTPGWTLFKGKNVQMKATSISIAHRLSMKRITGLAVSTHALGVFSRWFAAHCSRRMPRPWILEISPVAPPVNVGVSLSEGARYGRFLCLAQRRQY